MLDPRDGGYKSRKLWFAIGTSACIFLSCVLAATLLPRMENMLDSMFTALLGVLTVVCAANVGNKLVVGKTMAAMPAPAATPVAAKKQPLQAQVQGQPVEQGPNLEE
jgi:hypothetical protein